MKKEAESSQHQLKKVYHQPQDSKADSLSDPIRLRQRETKSRRK